PKTTHDKFKADYEKASQVPDEHETTDNADQPSSSPQAAHPPPPNLPPPTALNYAIPTSYHTIVQSYLTSSFTAPHPPPCDTSSIFTYHPSFGTYRSLNPSSSYTPVTPSAWLLIQSSFGGGPSVPCMSAATVSNVGKISTPPDAYKLNLPTRTFAGTGDTWLPFMARLCGKEGGGEGEGKVKARCWVGASFRDLDLAHEGCWVIDGGKVMTEDERTRRGRGGEKGEEWGDEESKDEEEEDERERREKDEDEDEDGNEEHQGEGLETHKLGTSDDELEDDEEDSGDESSKGGWSHSSSNSLRGANPTFTPTSAHRYIVVEVAPLHSPWHRRSCVAHLPLFRGYLLRGDHTADLNPLNPLGSGGAVTKAFAAVVKELHGRKPEGPVEPRAFRRALVEFKRDFAGNDQQDSQEFLGVLLDACHEDCNRIKQKPLVPAIEDSWAEKVDLPRFGREAWSRYLRRNLSPVSSLFHGLTLSDVACAECGAKSRSFDPWGMISCPINTGEELAARVTVFRRATGFNATQVFGGVEGEGGNPPSKNLVGEQYALSIPPLSDFGDIKLRLFNLTSIPVTSMILCWVEEGSETTEGRGYEGNFWEVEEMEDESSISSYFPGEGEEEVAMTLGEAPHTITRLVVFENTIYEKDILDDEDTSSELSGEDGETEEEWEDKCKEKFLSFYNSDSECALYDTSPILMSKIISSVRWPLSEDEVNSSILGLRFDMEDGNKTVRGQVIGECETEGKVKVHFDRYSTKWDREYGLKNFQHPKIRPLYMTKSASPPSPLSRIKVYHRRDRGQGDELVDENSGLDMPLHFNFGLTSILPFVLKAASAANPGGVYGDEDTEEEFNMSLVNSLGNVLTPRICVVVHWKGGKETSYQLPVVKVHEKSEREAVEMEREREETGAEGGGLKLESCLREYFKAQTLGVEEHFWMCPKCKDVREGKQAMSLWKCPDLLIVHLKRFNASSRWKSKIRTKVDFPLVGLDLSPFLHPSALEAAGAGACYMYDCCGVINHLGGISGGHYVAHVKVTECDGEKGEENVFVQAMMGDGAGSWMKGGGGEGGDREDGGKGEEEEASTKKSSNGGGAGSWFRKRMGMGGVEENSKTETELEEEERRRREGGYWVLADDDRVEEVCSDAVVSEAAYVLFYRKRNLGAYNMAEFG
ncbi:hypothetical protein TrRE_jg1886, partial [Triparma retinervis]